MSVTPFWISVILTKPSTSGSDSSLSDGLPVHLLSIAHELNQKKMYKKKKKTPLQTRKQRNEQYQKNMIREFKSTEYAPERAEIASTLQKQPTFFKNSGNTSSSTMKNEKPRMNELNGRVKGTSLDPPKMTTSYLTKERMQRKKPRFTVSCSPKRSTNTSQEPAPDMKPNWSRNTFPATQRGGANVVSEKQSEAS